MKAIVIFEIDEKVFDELSNEDLSDLSMRLLWDSDTMWVEKSTFRLEKSKYFDHVILRPMPEKKDVELYQQEFNIHYGLYAKGYNDCLEEIAGETE